MYATGIGLVIETIARMEHDEQLFESQQAERKKEQTETPVEVVLPTETPETEEQKDAKPKKRERRGLDLTEIVTTLSKIFTPDDIK
jgi:hypothetical protein